MAPCPSEIRSEPQHIGHCVYTSATTGWFQQRGSNDRVVFSLSVLHSDEEPEARVLHVCQRGMLFAERNPGHHIRPGGARWGQLFSIYLFFVLHGEMMSVYIALILLLGQIWPNEMFAPTCVF